MTGLFVQPLQGWIADLITLPPIASVAIHVQALQAWTIVSIYSLPTD